MRPSRSLLLATAGVLSAAILGGLAGCEQRTAEAPAPASPPADTAPAASDSRSFMASAVQPPTQVLWDFGYAEKMSDEDWAKVNKAATDLVAAMPTIAAGGFSAEEKARLLAHQNQEVERKNQEVEQARKALEEKAEQLALTSKYKSEFLANMSHELRTPLNSILILAQQLADNHEANLTSRQVEFSRTIHGAGTDLLNLISDILDLSKIESGIVTVDAQDVFLTSLVDMVSRPFRHEAETRGLSFDVSIDPSLDRVLYTDSKRLQQVLKNLLSNAFKFTRQGGVSLHMAPATSGWARGHARLDTSETVVAFTVMDTGIGIAQDKLDMIFEAFQQADGTTSRQYGGTGLGLSISREFARLLGGDIRVDSRPGCGATFTLYLSIEHLAEPGMARVPAAMVEARNA
jgi:hypothetical protein